MRRKYALPLDSTAVVWQLPEQDDAIGPPLDVRLLRRELRAFLSTKDEKGRSIGSSRLGVYAFYDYDGEPIYVGQTRESLSQRISRHMTNQRTDAVAMNVLDPFEVAEIEVWPIEVSEPSEAGLVLNAAEYSVFMKLLRESKFGAVLNEATPTPTAEVLLPQSYRGRIVPAEVYALRVHPDVRIARRAATIANLARVISERDVSKGLRVTLLTQARRLEDLAAARLAQLEIEADQRAPSYPQHTGEGDEV